MSKLRQWNKSPKSTWDPVQNQANKNLHSVTWLSKCLKSKALLQLNDGKDVSSTLLMGMQKSMAAAEYCSFLKMTPYYLAVTDTPGYLPR